MPISTLPKGLLRLIRSFLDFGSSVNFSKTCKRVYETFKEDENNYLKNIFFDKLFEPSSNYFFNYFLF